MLQAALALRFKGEVLKQAQAVVDAAAAIES